MITQELIREFKKYCDSYGWFFDSNSSEFTFQFRLGWFINFYYPSKYIVDFETHIRKFREQEPKYKKKEIDIHLLERDNLQNHAIEVKFVKDKMGYDISLFEMCRDIKFLEDMINHQKFASCYSIAFSTIANSYTAPQNVKYNLTHKRLSFYKKFREDHCITGNMYRNENEQFDFDKMYKLDWFDFSDTIKACVVEVT